MKIVNCLPVQYTQQFITQLDLNRVNTCEKQRSFSTYYIVKLATPRTLAQFFAETSFRATWAYKLNINATFDIFIFMRPS